MKKITLQEKTQVANELLEEIKALHTPGEQVRFMEVCGTHTVAIFREGIRQLLPDGIELVSGPGCPVCVTDQVYMDKALAYAAMDDVIVATFGDMLKVPGTHSNLWEAKSAGAHIHIIYSPLEIIELGKANPDKKSYSWLSVLKRLLPSLRRPLRQWLCPVLRMCSSWYPISWCRRLCGL